MGNRRRRRRRRTKEPSLGSGVKRRVRGGEGREGGREGGRGG